MLCPIDYFTDNLIFNHDKSCWAVYSLDGFNYEMLSASEKVNILNRLTRFIAGLETEAKILIVPVERDIKEHFKRLRSRLSPNDPLYDDAIRHNELTENYLTESIEGKGSVNDYKTYVIVKLQSSDDDAGIFGNAKDIYEYFVKSPKNAVDVFMNLDGVSILKSKIERFKKLADIFHSNQSKRISLTEAGTDELQWLLRRMSSRGTNKEVKLFTKTPEQPWTPFSEEHTVGEETVITPYKRDITRLFSGAITQEHRCIKIDNGKDEISYQAFLPITSIPECMEFPTCEWIYRLQKHNVQAEICIHIKSIGYRKSLEKIEKKKREITSQAEHISQAGSAVPGEIYESMEYADMMEKEIKDTRLPMLQTSISICLAADNLNDLEKKVSLVRNDYKDMGFSIERPVADQLKLYLQHFPSVGVCVRDFNIFFHPRTLASGIFGATRELGDTVGPYIGTTGIEKKHVFLDLGLACREDKSPVATFYGDLGFGKSFNANLLLYLAVVLLGGYGLVIDPKSERTHWVEKLPTLDGQINLVTLSPDPKYKGMLDPFNIYRNDIDEACELALNIIAELLIERSERKSTLLLETMEKIKFEKLPSMERVIELLAAVPSSDSYYEEASDLARALNARKNNSMTQLLFGNGTEKSIKLEHRLNIFQIDNLKLPEPHVPKQDYTREQSISVIMMMVMGNFAKRFAQSLPNNLKVVLLDESWMLGSTTSGASLIAYLTRTSRKLYTSIILNGHSVLDIPDKQIRNTITYKFCFHTNSEEAMLMLDYLNLEITADNIELVTSLENRECLFQDSYGRVGVLKFDAVFEELIEVFSTTPKDIFELERKEKAKLSNVIPLPSVENIEEIDIESIELEEIDIESIDIYAYETPFEWGGSVEA